MKRFKIGRFTLTFSWRKPTTSEAIEWYTTPLTSSSGATVTWKQNAGGQ